MKKTAWTSMALSMMICFVFYGMDAFAQTTRGAGVLPEKLPKELREISPRDYFISSSQKQVGVIHTLEGTVVVRHGATGEAYFGMAGDTVYEKDSLTTLAESKCRIRFLDEDIVTMGPATEFSVESFEDQRAQGTKSSFFKMVKGKAMFYALRLFRYRDTRFTLVTPTTTIGVRGTKFGADVYYLEPGKTADRGILVADGRNEIAPYLLAQAGMQVVTNLFSMDGTVNANGLLVGPGQYYNSQTHQVNPTPPDLLLQFQQQTQIGGGTLGQGTTSGGDQITPPGAQTSTGPATADILANITTQVQTQTQETVLQEAHTDKEITSLPRPLDGYFSLLLSRNGTFYDAFLTSSRSRTDPNLDSYMYGLMSTSNYLRVTSPTGQPDRGEAYLGGVLDSGSVDTPWTKVYVGQNTYTQWGYWEGPEGSSHFDMGNPSASYQFIRDRVWFAEGNNVTTQAQFSAIPSGSVAYSGSSYGTYTGSDGVGQLSGTFSSRVNFGSNTIQDVILSGRGDGHTYDIRQTGTAVSIMTNSSGNSWHINSSNLTATIDSTSAGYKQVNGSIYGPNGEEMAGNAAAADSLSRKGVSLIFNGKKAP